MELSEEGVPQWRWCFDGQCEARFESNKALATHVLRHHRQMEVVSRSVITNQCPVHRHLLSSLRRGSCCDKSRCLGQVHIPLSLRCPICSAELGNWSKLEPVRACVGGVSAQSDGDEGGRHQNTLRC